MFDQELVDKIRAGDAPTKSQDRHAGGRNGIRSVRVHQRNG